MVNTVKKFLNLVAEPQSSIQSNNQLKAYIRNNLHFKQNTR